MCLHLIASVTRHVLIGNNIELIDMQLLFSLIHTKFIVTVFYKVSILFSYLVSCFSITLTITSKPSLSSLVNRSVIGASISRTPIISSLTWIGITISDLLFASQAMWPGNACTSLTNWVLSSATAVPQTPLPIAIWTQAGWPWKGPRMSSSFSIR